MASATEVLSPVLPAAQTRVLPSVIDGSDAAEIAAELAARFATLQRHDERRMAGTLTRLDADLDADNRAEIAGLVDALSAFAVFVGFGA